MACFIKTARRKTPARSIPRPKRGGTEPESQRTGPKTAEDTAPEEIIPDTIFVNLLADSSAPYYSHPSGHPLCTKTIFTSVEVVPFSWECCACGFREWLTLPGYGTVAEPNIDTFPYHPSENREGSSELGGDPGDIPDDNPNVNPNNNNPNNPNDIPTPAPDSTPAPKVSEICPRCDARSCYNCKLISQCGAEICNFGGKNLLKDCLTPAGWKCCLCENTHYGVSRYRPDLHVRMEALCEGSENEDMKGNGGGEGGEKEGGAREREKRLRC